MKLQLHREAVVAAAVGNPEVLCSHHLIIYSFGILANKRRPSFGDQDEKKSIGGKV